MLICPKCKIEYEDGKFCRECGSPLSEVEKVDYELTEVPEKVYCIQCGAENEGTDKFCTSCGVNLQTGELPTKKTSKKIKRTIITIIIVGILIGFGFITIRGLIPLFSKNARIQGKVLDLVTGEPIQKATITIADSSITATTDENGEYTLKGVIPGTRKIIAQKEDYTMDELSIVAGEKEKITADHLKIMPKLTHYGMFLIADKRIIELIPVKMFGGGFFDNGIKGIKIPPEITIFDTHPILIFYSNPKEEEQISKYMDITLSKLRYEETAYEEFLGTWREVDVNMWRSYEDIEPKIKPVKGMDNMYQYTLPSSLSEGAYAVHYGNFSNRDVDVSPKVVYPFNVERNKEEESEKNKSENHTLMRNKEKEDGTREVKTNDHLANIRAAINNYRTTNDGFFPVNLDDKSYNVRGVNLPPFVLDYMPRIPKATLRSSIPHNESNKVTIVRTRANEDIQAGQITDEGGWIYSSNSGDCRVNCNHKDSAGLEYYKYGHEEP